MTVVNISFLDAVGGPCWFSPCADDAMCWQIYGCDADQNRQILRPPARGAKLRVPNSGCQTLGTRDRNGNSGPVFRWQHSP